MSSFSFIHDENSFYSPLRGTYGGPYFTKRDLSYEVLEEYIFKIADKIGAPIFTENKKSFQSEEITYNFKTKKCYVKEIKTKEGEGYILGENVKKVTNEIFYIQKGDYTTCDADPPHFSIRSNKINDNNSFNFGRDL